MTDFFNHRGARLVTGECRARLREIDAESVQCVVTSPPYWGLRDYGVKPSIWGGTEGCAHKWTKDAPRFCQRCGAWCGCLGLEPTPDLFVQHMVEVFREVNRVLKPDGTLWLNLGDSYATGGGHVGDHPGGGAQGSRWAGAASPNRGGRTRALRDGSHSGKHTAMAAMGPMTQPNRLPIPGLKPKDLVGIPWRVALALQADGWWLRSDIIWSKPNPMPESIEDRPTRAHEYLFLLTKSRRYHYDAEAIRERATSPVSKHTKSTITHAPGQKPHRGFQKKNELRPESRVVGLNARWDAAEEAGDVGAWRNKRSVWNIAPEPSSEAHFAVMPTALAEPCILAGSRPGDLVVDPFSGSGTVATVAYQHGRRALGIDLNETYCGIAARRLAAEMRQGRLAL